MEKHYSLVYVASGSLQGEMIRLFLESNDIKPLVYQESAGTTYGFTVGLLGAVKIYVHDSLLEKAKELLIELDRGDFQTEEDLDTKDTPGNE
jgi:hypothetical protein